MQLTELELKALEDGTLTHCGEPVSWDDCPDHDTDCFMAICIQCKNAWQDCLELGVN